MEKSQNVGTKSAFTHLFYFLFLYLFSFHLCCLFCLGMVETRRLFYFWFGLLVGFDCKKLTSLSLCFDMGVI